MLTVPPFTMSRLLLVEVPWQSLRVNLSIVTVDEPDAAVLNNDALPWTFCMVASETETKLMPPLRMLNTPLFWMTISLKVALVRYKVVYWCEFCKIVTVSPVIFENDVSVTETELLYWSGPLAKIKVVAEILLKLDDVITKLVVGTIRPAAVFIKSGKKLTVFGAVTESTAKPSIPIELKCISLAAWINLKLLATSMFWN